LSENWQDLINVDLLKHKPITKKTIKQIKKQMLKSLPLIDKQWDKKGKNL